jgi:hypothetical protein
MPDVVAVRDTSRTTMCHWSASVLPVNLSSSQSRASCSRSLRKYLEEVLGPVLVCEVEQIHPFLRRHHGTQTPWLTRMRACPVAPVGL